LAPTDETIDADLPPETSEELARALVDRLAIVGLWNPRGTAFVHPKPGRRSHQQFEFALFSGGFRIHGPGLHFRFSPLGDLAAIMLSDFDVDEVRRLPVVLDVQGAEDLARRHAADRTGYFQPFPTYVSSGVAWWSQPGEADLQLCRRPYGMMWPISVSLVRPKKPIRPE
jgi:hypothetical protein